MDEVKPARFKPASKENMREVSVESGTKNKSGLLARSYRSTTGKAWASPPVLHRQ